MQSSFQYLIECMYVSFLIEDLKGKLQKAFSEA